MIQINWSKDILPTIVNNTNLLDKDLEVVKINKNVSMVQFSDILKNTDVIMVGKEIPSTVIRYLDDRGIKFPQSVGIHYYNEDTEQYSTADTINFDTKIND